LSKQALSYLLESSERETEKERKKEEEEEEEGRDREERKKQNASQPPSGPRPLVILSQTGSKSGGAALPSAISQ
jgi:hypothetical protein